MSLLRPFAALLVGVVATTACSHAAGDHPEPDTITLESIAPQLLEDDDAVLVVGDSLANGARTFGQLERRLGAAGFEDIEVVAESGRDVSWAVGQLEDRLTVPELVVVELGTNPSAATDGFAEAVADLVDVLRSRGAERIAWLTPAHGRDDRYDDKAEVLANVPGIDLLADWASLVHDDPDRLAADGLHPTRDGYTDLARFLVSTAAALAAIEPR